MGWYIRKAIRLGPLRLNLSKSGIGYSVGVKGARVGVGQKGSYVHLGRGGLYYRAGLSPSNQSASSSRDNPIERTCRTCGTDLSEIAQYCRNCGTAVDAGNVCAVSWWWIVAVIVLAIAVIAIFTK
jgi:hypothetical protein